MSNKKQIWDETFRDNSVEDLGWYEEIPEPSFSLVKKYLSQKDKLIIDAGCGRGTLLSNLLKDNYTNLLGVDLSSEAINSIGEDLRGEMKDSMNLNFIVGDLTKKIDFFHRGCLWHDRAVFHFLLTDVEREGYISNLKKFLEENGIFILACFSKKNIAEMCNGFPVKKYDVAELEIIFQKDFTLVENFEYNYTMPWGDQRNFVYMVFRKKLRK